MKKLFILPVVIVSCLTIGLAQNINKDRQLKVKTAQNKKAETKTFSSSELHYATCPSPKEEFSFTWDIKTGQITRFYWKHGSAEWFLYTNTPMNHKVIAEPNPSYYYNVEMYVTTKGFETTAYKITGKLTLNATYPNGATFAGIYEGSGTDWMGAKGTFSEK